MSLVDHRGIFIASIVAKIFERVLKNRTETYMKNILLFQAGGRSNRGPPDNTFILNAVTDHCIYVDRSLHVTAYGRSSNTREDPVRSIIICCGTGYCPTRRVVPSDMCSAITGEYCATNKGVAVGTCIVSSLAFVDYMLKICH